MSNNLHKAEEIEIREIKEFKIKNHIKCVILGDSGIGKTSIIKTYHNNHFDTYNETTLGATYWELNYEYSKSMNIKINFWDTAGQERYNSLIPMYVRECDIVILAFDLTDLNSFKNLKKWYKFVLNNYSNPKVIVVGNKEDLKIYHIVEQDSIELFLQNNFKIMPKFFRTSAKKNINIENLFNHIFSLINEIINNRKKICISNDNINFYEKTKNENYKCCNIL